MYFSYSGLKTYVINLVHNYEQKGEEVPKADVAASFQKAAVAQLVDVLTRAIDDTGIKKIAVAGGVSANALLRSEFDRLAKQGCDVHYPKLKYCTDNASMIGAEAYQLIRSGADEAELSLDASATVSIVG